MASDGVVACVCRGRAALKPEKERERKPSTIPNRKETSSKKSLKNFFRANGKRRRYVFENPKSLKNSPLPGVSVFLKSP
jgi:hypothetical protein